MAAGISQMLDEEKADDITMLECAKTFKIADYMVIATGASSRHVKHLADTVYEKMKEKKVKTYNVHGADSGKWAVIDFGDVIVHVFTHEFRDLYALEEMWSDSPKVDWKE